MSKSLLTLLMSLQLMLTPAAPMQTIHTCTPAQPTRLWWGLIDPELSVWFARLPLETQNGTPILWDWSWRSFLASLFGQPVMKEAIPDAAHA